MAITEADVQSRLRALIDPDTGKDFVSGKAVRKVEVGAGGIVVDIQLGYPAKTQHEMLKKLIAQDLGSLPGAPRVTVNMTQKITSHAVQRGVKLIHGVKSIIAVASGKGGVGKSTRPSTSRWPRGRGCQRRRARRGHLRAVPAVDARARRQRRTPGRQDARAARAYGAAGDVDRLPDR